MTINEWLEALASMDNPVMSAMGESVIARIASLEVELEKAKAERDENARSRAYCRDQEEQQKARAERAQTGALRLKEENERLREALENIAETEESCALAHHGTLCCLKEASVGREAREAIAALSRQESAPKSEACCKDWPHDDERHGHAIPPEAATKHICLCGLGHGTARQCGEAMRNVYPCRCPGCTPSQAAPDGKELSAPCCHKEAHYCAQCSISSGEKHWHCVECRRLHKMNQESHG